MLEWRELDYYIPDQLFWLLQAVIKELWPVMLIAAQTLLMDVQDINKTHQYQ